MILTRTLPERTFHLKFDPNISPVYAIQDFPDRTVAFFRNKSDLALAAIMDDAEFIVWANGVPRAMVKPLPDTPNLLRLDPEWISNVGQVWKLKLDSVRPPLDCDFANWTIWFRSQEQRERFRMLSSKYQALVGTKRLRFWKDILVVVDQTIYSRWSWVESDRAIVFLNEPDADAFFNWSGDVQRAFCLDKMRFDATTGIKLRDDGNGFHVGLISQHPDLRDGWVALPWAIYNSPTATLYFATEYLLARYLHCLTLPEQMDVRDCAVPRVDVARQRKAQEIHARLSLPMRQIKASGNG